MVFVVAQSVEQQWSNPEVVGSNPTEVKERFFTSVVWFPISFLGLTLRRKYLGWFPARRITLELILYIPVTGKALLHPMESNTESEESEDILFQTWSDPENESTPYGNSDDEMRLTVIC